MGMRSDDRKFGDVTSRMTSDRLMRSRSSIDEEVGPIVEAAAPPYESLWAGRTLALSACWRETAATAVVISFGAMAPHSPIKIGRFRMA